MSKSKLIEKKKVKEEVSYTLVEDGILKIHKTDHEVMIRGITENHSRYQLEVPFMTGARLKDLNNLPEVLMKVKMELIDNIDQERDRIKEAENLIDAIKKSNELKLKMVREINTYLEKK